MLNAFTSGLVLIVFALVVLLLIGAVRWVYAKVDEQLMHNIEQRRELDRNKPGVGFRA